MNVKKSQELFDDAVQVIPGGVNSPVRSFGSVGGTPRFVARGQGSHILDVDENSYVDYVLSWGPLILGHAHPRVVAALTEQVERGTSYGAPTQLELDLAKMVRQAVPSMEMVRMVNSGTEACMSALRLARGFTNRNKILKFEGCYHGHADALLVNAGSGAAMLGQASSAGVTAAAASDTLVAPYNDLQAVEALFEVHGEDIACIIVEPVAGNMGPVLPQPGYLEGLRRITEEHGSLLIFDEVLTGFRVAHGGAQQRYRILPDITCLGKVIGGGLPVGAYGGRRDVMEMVAPLGPVYQAGTLSGNPLAMAAGIATLEVLQDPEVYRGLEEHTTRLCNGLEELGRAKGIPMQVVHVGSLWGLFFSEQPVKDFGGAKGSDGDKHRLFFHGMLRAGVYLPPSPMETAFVSTAHSESDVAMTIDTCDRALDGLA